jgi:hypothetical protein
MRELGRRASLLWHPEGYAKALEMSVCFHRGPVLENMEGRSFPRAFERRQNLFIY